MLNDVQTECFLRPWQQHRKYPLFRWNTVVFVLQIAICFIMEAFRSTFEKMAAWSAESLLWYKNRSNLMEFFVIYCIFLWEIRFNLHFQKMHVEKIELDAKSELEAHLKQVEYFMEFCH